MASILTLIADRQATTLSAAVIQRVYDAVQGRALDILSDGEAADISCLNPPDERAIEAALEGLPIDAIVTKSRGRRKAVLVADMDSTIVTGETLDELAAFAGIGEQIAAITKRSMNGELDFTQALRERVGMLKGLRLSALEETWKGVKLTPGARELVGTMRAHNATTALVSGGFTFFTGRVAELVGFHVHRANTLIDDGEALTGQTGQPILDRYSKLEILRELAEARGVQMSATLAVGDGANDLDMIREAGLGVAFHAKPIVAREAKARVEHGNLRALLFAQGYRASEFAA
ncbi:MAG: phosphoserine phosphatase SerB [Acetobacteraceae bacterium]|nr:phosphoserine phosphatase SerB [Acetobacteraceae bacterium]